ncbi:MAG: hypothetical protein IT328_07685 [Caldilineaceae bacterium]|nr:hypothetical protein [Caldilineaceae bacterium]
MLATLGCAAGDVFARPTATPPPTRVSAPTFTPTPDFIQGLVVVTPPHQGTPGVIVIPPGVDPRSVIPIPETPTLTVTPTPTPEPTSMPGGGTPTIVVEVPVEVDFTPTAIAVLIPPPTPTTFDSPLLVPTNTPVPLPTVTPTVALPTSTPTVTPTPYVVVANGLVSLRSGPGPDYPLVAQLGPDIPVAITGQNPEGTWYEICCVNGGSVWVAQAHVQAVNDTSEVLLVLTGPAPTATATGTATATPTITPTPTATPYGFQVVEGPLYFPSGNEMLTIWAKISAGGGTVPLPGYFIKVKWRNSADGSSFEDRPNTRGEAPSADTFEYNVPPGPGSGNRVQFNYKFEFLPPDPKASDPKSTQTRASLMNGYWQIYVVDGAGTQLSDAIEFSTLTGNINREVYVAWSLTP